MTQYSEKVEAVKIRQAAEEWASGVKTLHSHQLKSMWYDDRPADTDDSPVMDIQYNDGSVQRTILKTGEKIIMGTKLQGEALIDEYTRNNPSN